MTTNMLPSDAQYLKAYYAGNVNVAPSTSAVLVEMGECPARQAGFSRQSAGPSGMDPMRSPWVT